MAKRALLLIDVQKNMFDLPGVVGADELFPRWQGLLQAARTNGDFVIHIQHCGDGPWDDAPGKDGWQTHPAVAPHPGELVVQKASPSAFEGTPLDAVLHALDVSNLVIAGLQTEMCITATSKAAHALGYDVTLVADGHGTYDSDEMDAATRVRLANEELAATVTVRPSADVAW